MSDLVKVIRNRPGLVTPINGVAFEPYEDVSISEAISREVAELFLGVPGYALNGDAERRETGSAAAAQAAAEAEQQAAAQAQKQADEAAAREAADKAAKEAAEAEAKRAEDAAAQAAAEADAKQKSDAAKPKTSGRGKTAAAPSDNVF